MKNQEKKLAYEVLILKSLIVSFILSMAIILGSCSKNETTEPTPTSADTQTTQDESAAQSEFDDAVKITEEAIDSANTETYPTTTLSFANCAIITSDTINNTIEVDFGNTGCLGIDGRTREGKITITYFGNYRDPGSAFNVSFDQYTVDGVSISGSISYYTLERNVDNNLEFSTQVSNGLLVYPNGDEIKWEAQRSLTWTEGEATGDIFDDVFEISGKSSGENSNGVGYTSEITVPITLKTACWNQYIFYPVKGIKQIIPNNESMRSIDFGDGECDKVVTITIGNFTYIVTLP